jgi:uncharacterized protein YjiS (DUF1127 family)
MRLEMAQCINTIAAIPGASWFARITQPGAARSRTDCAADPAAERSEAPAALMASRDAGPLVRRLAAEFREWRHRARSRRELARLDERMLKDIGISRVEVELEVRKPFWRA